MDSLQGTAGGSVAHGSAQLSSRGLAGCWDPPSLAAASPAD